jgi:hypothetical protein
VIPQQVGCLQPYCAHSCSKRAFPVPFKNRQKIQKTSYLTLADPSFRVNLNREGYEPLTVIFEDLVKARAPHQSIPGENAFETFSFATDILNK